MNFRSVDKVLKGNGFHWVGDGFYVNNFFPSPALSFRDTSPFLMLDYNAPMNLAPTSGSKGVGGHPHKGFETVSFVWSGQIAHRDSAGNSGTLGPGDVQWMTAGSGILHEEFHHPEFASQGGLFHMAQLWVNLPASCKNLLPAYQDIANSRIPIINLPEDSGTVKLIAGNAFGVCGPAKTQTPITVADIFLKSGGAVSLDLPDGFTCLALLLSGSVSDNFTNAATGPCLLGFSRNGSFAITAQSGAHLLLLSGKPIDEPIAHYGPFVMNTREEILQAFEEFQSGKFGNLD